MTRSAKIFFGVYMAASLLALVLSQAHASAEDPRQKSVKDYRNWFKVTPEPVYMEPQVSALCMSSPGYSALSPHVRTYFRVYVNLAGRAAMTSKRPVSFPAGSVIVKEKFSVPENGTSAQPKIKAGAKPKLLTVMVKREFGFDPKNGDWEYFTCDGNGVPASPSLSVDHCKSCHLSQKKRDFVYRDYGPSRRL